MSEQVPERIPDSQLAHVKFFIVFLVSYFLAENITYGLNSFVPEIFGTLGRVFQGATLPLFLVLIQLILVRIFVSLLPELSIDNSIRPYIAVIPLLILTHPLYISIDGDTLTMNWLVLDIIFEERLLDWIMEIIIFGFGGYTIYMIQYRSKGRSSRINQIIRYLGKEILVVLFFFLVLFYLVRSFTRGDLESIILTNPVRLVLLILFFYGTLPIEKEETTTNNEIDN